MLISAYKRSVETSRGILNSAGNFSPRASVRVPGQAPSSWNMAKDSMVSFSSLIHLFHGAAPVEVPPTITRQQYLDIVENGKGD